MFCSGHAGTTYKNKHPAASVMQLLPVSALSSWVHCPRAFYLSYVLEIEEPPKDVMILGLIKHKLHEQISDKDEEIVTAIKPSDNVAELLQNTYTTMLKNIITNQANALRMVKVPLVSAFQKALPIVKFEATDRALRILPLLGQGLTGEQLWQSLTPKVKTEYSIQSKKLGLKGRIDRLELHNTGLLPVELKSGNPPQEGVWDGHRIQAASYALMLEDVFSAAVPEAVVQYVDHNLRRIVVLNPFLKEQIQDVTSKVRSCIETKELPDGCGRESCSSCNDPIFTQNRV
jgi:CRISPR/Cas system-associated exonuclease Cas4 (RecB family)